MKQTSVKLRLFLSSLHALLTVIDFTLLNDVYLSYQDQMHDQFVIPD